MDKPSDSHVANNNDLRPDLKCISFSKRLYKREDCIQCCFVYHILTPYILLTVVVLKRTCEAIVRAISIVVRISNALQRLFVVVRTSSYNNAACVLQIVTFVF